MPTIPTFTVKSGYQPQAIDTSLEVDLLMFELLRQLTPQQAAERLRSHHRVVRKLAIAGIENQYSVLTGTELRQEFVKRCWGSETQLVSNYSRWFPKAMERCFRSFKATRREARSSLPQPVGDHPPTHRFTQHRTATIRAIDFCTKDFYNKFLFSKGSYEIRGTTRRNCWIRLGKY